MSIIGKIETPSLFWRIKRKILRFLFPNRYRFDRIIFPVVKNVSLDICLKDFISVQPMNLPQGTVFYLDFKYSEGKVKWYKKIWRKLRNK